MPRRKSSPPPKKASGANIEEWQRRTVAVKLRLDPLEATALHQGAERHGISLSDYVGRLVIADLANGENRSLP